MHLLSILGVFCDKQKTYAHSLDQFIAVCPNVRKPPDALAGNIDFPTSCQEALL